LTDSDEAARESLNRQPRAQSGEAKGAWLMVALAFLSQGAAYGMTFGLAGSFIGPAEAQFHASRAASSLGVSLVALLHGLLGPVVGRWLARGSVRTVMTAGALAMCAAYLTMYLAPNIWVFCLGFGLLGGVAVALLGVTPVTTLVGRWFPTRSGQALGLANMPILVTVLPFVGGLITATYGWHATTLAVAVAALALVPALHLVRDPPGFDSQEITEVRAGRAARFTPDAQFWMLVFGVGVLDGSGITIITHIVPYATEVGIAYQQATLLVSVMGVCGLAGAPLLGLLADRMGGPYTLSAVAAALIAGWLGLILSPPYVVIMAIIGLLGFCGGAFAGLLGTTLSNRYRGARLGPAVGLAVMCALPFNFALPLLAGYMHDRTGTYRWTFAYHVVLFLVALGMFLSVGRRSRAATPSLDVVQIADASPGTP
jgi:predicted MFS family arabinose efflux permease